MGGERYKSKKATVECRAYMSRKRKIGLKSEDLRTERTTRRR